MSTQELGVVSVRRNAAVIALPANRQMDDVALIAAYRHGDVRAFEMLFERHQRRLHSLGVRYLHDPAEAADVVQEAFLRLLRIADQVGEGFKVMAWLHRVAANLCLSLLRSRRRSQLVSGDEEWLLGARDQHRSVQPEEAYEMGLARERLVQVATGLPAQQRVAFLMREVGGHSYDEIAARLGITHGAVESLLFRARRRFKQEYLRLEEEDSSPRAAVGHPVEVIGRARRGPWPEQRSA